MARKRKRSKGSENEGTTLLTARVKVSVFDLVDAAARIRGLDRQDVIERGSTKESIRIIETAMREIRRYKERQRKARAAARKAKRKGTA